MKERSQLTKSRDEKKGRETKRCNGKETEAPAAFTHCMVPATIPARMARQRYSPSALIDPKLSIVIPVYNEKDTIDEILRRVLPTEPRKEVIVVDDGSTDGTKQILEAMAGLQAKGDASAPAQDGADSIPLRDLRFFFQGQNQGKGAALRRGFAQATG